tara:strand:+ start:174 stop:467 length:294 start_codon:yes stop_codon:yes gene_type:complete
MKLSRRKLRRIIREEKQKLFESQYDTSGLNTDEFESWAEVDQILADLSDKEYFMLEQCAYDLADAFGKTSYDSESASYVVAVLVKVVIPKLKSASIV